MHSAAAHGTGVRHYHTNRHGHAHPRNFSQSHFTSHPCTRHMALSWGRARALAHTPNPHSPAMCAAAPQATHSPAPQFTHMPGVRGVGQDGELLQQVPPLLQTNSARARSAREGGVRRLGIGEEAGWSCARPARRVTQLPSVCLVVPVFSAVATMARTARSPCGRRAIAERNPLAGSQHGARSTHLS